MLAQTDSWHDTLSGPATKVLLTRAVERFGERRYALLSQISVSHLYNLRASEPYRKQRLIWHATRPSSVAIGIRKAPAPQGLPGYIRIDTVHQGDRDGIKGVYHINAVDMVTQPEVPTINEAGLKGFLASSWYGLVAPAGTPREIVDKLHAMRSSRFRTSRCPTHLLNG